jgi:hypothetical protein
LGNIIYLSQEKLEIKSSDFISNVVAGTIVTLFPSFSPKWLNRMF